MIRIFGGYVAAAACFLAVCLLAACSADPDQHAAQLRGLDREFPQFVRGPRPLPEGTYFVFAYFKDPDPDLYLAISTDGYSYMPVDGEPVMRSPLGLRDPSIARGPDGVYRMVATGGSRIGAGQIVYAESRDLLVWSPARALIVVPNQPGTECWAPELVYDEAQGVWEIAFSASIPGRFEATSWMAKANHRLYSVTTHDFVTLSPPELLLDPGYPCIDAAFLHDGDQWRLFFKDEREHPARKVLRSVEGPSPRGPWGPPSTALTIHNVEGPCPLKVGTDWIVYFDEFTRGRYGAIRSEDLRSWMDVSGQMRFPVGARHGTFFAVPPDLGKPLAERAGLEKATR